MKTRVFYKQDGSVVVVYAVDKSKKESETEEEWLERVFSKAVAGQPELAGLPYDDIDSSKLPSREYRNIWEGSKGTGVFVRPEKQQQHDSEKQRRLLILQEKEKILEQQAIQSLIDQGKL